MYWNGAGRTDMEEWAAININMRCIEILELAEKKALYSAININMRCIEILDEAAQKVDEID